MEELKAHFNVLLKIIQDSFIAYNNLSVMVESRKHVKILNEDFFRFLQYQQFFMLNIQLCKILECKPSQQRNIVTLCNNLIKGDYQDEIITFWDNLQPSIEYIDKNYDRFIDKVKGVRQKIRLSNNVINKLCDARNKVYAHTDIDRQIKHLNLAELKELLDLSAFAYNNTRGALYGANADFNHGLINLNMKGLIRILEARISCEKEEAIK